MQAVATAYGPSGPSCMPPESPVARRHHTAAARNRYESGRMADCSLPLRIPHECRSSHSLPAALQHTQARDLGILSTVFKAPCAKAACTGMARESKASFEIKEGLLASRAGQGENLLYDVLVLLQSLTLHRSAKAPHAPPYSVWSTIGLCSSLAISTGRSTNVDARRRSSFRRLLEESVYK
jgi:hypothetical protein